jgi:hypothetical protein
MLFGLINALAIFQKFINNVLAPCLDQCCTAYLDDMLIYSDTFEDHQKYINLFLEAFKKADTTLPHKLSTAVLGLCTGYGYFLHCLA